MRGGRDPYAAARDPYAKAPRPPRRARSRSEDSYTYSEGGGDEPGAAVAGSAWGNGTLARAPAPEPGADPYGYHYDQFYQQQQQRYDPYRAYDPYAQSSGKGGYPSSASGYAPQPGYPPPGYPPPPSGYGGPRDERETRYSSHYGYYGHPGYPAPPGYGYPPPGYPPPPPGYGAPPAGYGHDPNRYASDRGGGRGRSRSRGRNNNKGGARKRGGGGGGGGGKGGAQARGEQRNDEGGKKNKKKMGDEMEEFMLGGTKPDLKLSEVLANFEANAKDQIGSRFLQMTVDEGNEEDSHAIFEAMLPTVSKLSVDQFGNYLVQRLIWKGSETQREGIAQEIKSDVVKLSNDKCGCRVIQKAVEVMKPELQVAVSQDLRADVLGCIKSMHGNHVIQKCVENMLPEHITFIVEAVESNVEFIAAHMYGCRVVQRLLERIPREEGAPRQQLEKMLDMLMKHVKKLMRDQHGNYVVQCILQKGTRIEDKRSIIQAVIDNPIEYAKNKCSSNVVERCLEICAEGDHKEELAPDREALMHALMGKPNDRDAPLKELMADKFGNFIVSKMIKYSRGNDRALLKQQLEAEEENLRNSQSGKHILTTMQKEFGED